MVNALAYEGRGTGGVPLVLIHGFPLDRAVWTGQLTGLGNLARVVAVDLPGFGQSPPPTTDVLTMDDLADHVMALVNGLGFERFVAGGLSMGGYVVMAIARRFPERLCGILLSNTRAEPDTPEAKKQRLTDAAQVTKSGVAFLAERQLKRMVSPETLQRPDIIGQVNEMMRRSSPAGVAAALRGMAQRPDARPTLGQPDVPALVIAGADDPIAPPALAQQMAARFKQAEMAVVPAAGHLAPLGAPDAVNTALRKLLRRAAHVGSPSHAKARAARAAAVAEVKAKEVAHTANTKDGDYEEDEATTVEPPRPRRGGRGAPGLHDKRS